MKSKVIYILMVLIGICSAVFAGDSAPELNRALTLSKNANGFTISAAADDAALSSGRLNIIVLSPGKSFETAAPEDICDFGFFENLKPGDKVLYKFVCRGEIGVYNVKATWTNQLSQSLSAAYTWEKVSDERVSECINAFGGDAWDKIKDDFTKYTAEEMIDTSGVEITDELCRLFVTARDMIKDKHISEIITGINSTDDIQNTLKIAVMLNNIQNNEQYDTAAENLKLAPKLIEAEINKFMAVYNEIKTDEISYGKIKQADALAHIKNETRESISDALGKYAEFLGVDTKYLEDNQITLPEIAKYVDNSNISQYKNGMGDFIKATADTIIAARKTGAQPSSGGSGGSGGGGCGGAVAAIPVKNIPARQQETQNRFEDTDGFLWANEAINALADKNILNGINEKSFQPERKITREEFTKIIVSAFDIKQGTSNLIPFKDIDISRWSYAYINSAYNNGIVTGTDGEKFGAEECVTRQDAAVICYRVMKLKGKLSGADNEKKYADDDKTAAYAKKAVSEMTATGIINGYEDETFRPGEHTTRAQAAVVVWRLLKYFE